MIFVDVETGGIEPRINALLSIGAVSGKDKFYTEIKPANGFKVEQQALAVNGLYNYKEHEKTLNEGIQDFKDWVDSLDTTKIISGWNVQFDVEFLKVGFKYAAITYPFSFRIVDVHSVAYAVYPELRVNRLGNSKDGVAKFLNLPPEKKPHNALNGAIHVKQIYDEIQKDLA
jgi:DNA polymerase III epsilon subunit-like protein